MSLSANRWARRLETVPVVALTALVLTTTIPLWLPLVVAIDLVRLRLRFPIARLLAFAVCWAWLETVGVAAAVGLTLLGRGRDQRALFALQRWWARQLTNSLRATCGLSFAVDNVEAFEPGPVLLFVRHASLADALVSAYVTTNVVHMKPRFVLKRELLADPCLDIVGNRLPNYFVDRGANDSAAELAALEHLVVGMADDDVGIIFPEGTRANSAKRVKALERIAERDPKRAAQLAALKHLLPPRPSGAQAMVRGAKGADVVFAWHVGFEGLDTFTGILRGLNHRLQPIHFVAHRVANVDIPSGESFTTWLDDQWLAMDAEVDAALKARRERER